MDVATARRQLTEALGERSSTYWTTLRQWYKQKITKPEFDDQAKALLGEQNVHCHNEFLLAILAKCQTVQPHLEQTEPTVSSTRHSLSPSGSVDSGSYGGLSHRKQSAVSEDQQSTSVATKRKHRPSSTHFETVFLPVSSTDFMQSPQQGKEDCFHCHGIEFYYYVHAKQIQLCSQDMCLPDAVSLYGRLLLTALDMELDNVADDVPQLVSLAVEDFIKNIFSGIVGRRKSYTLRNGHFRHSYSWDPPLQKRQKICNSRGTKIIGTGPSLTASKIPTRCQRVLYGTHESEAAQILSTRMCGQRRGLITLDELRDTLQVDRRLVPSNAVLCTNMERLLAKMWHSGTFEQNHESLYKHALQRLSGMKSVDS